MARNSFLRKEAMSIRTRENPIEWKLAAATAAGGQYPTRGDGMYKDQGNPYRNKGLAEGLEQKT